jgi:hypothetical protein
MGREAGAVAGDMESSKTSMNTKPFGLEPSWAKPLNRMWEWNGWLPFFLLTVLIAIPPGLIWGPQFSQTSGPVASVPNLT